MKKSKSSRSMRRAGSLPAGRIGGALLVIGLGLWILGGWGAAAEARQPFLRTEGAGQSPDTEDLRTPDAVLKALYESLTFAEGDRPDLDRFTGLFASLASPCIRVTPGAVLATDLRGFLENFGDRVRAGAIKSFQEEEISRRSIVYGNIIQVFSVYRKTVNSSSPQDSIRGVNSLQLCRLEGRWRISSLVWQDETADYPIPEKFQAP